MFFITVLIHRALCHKSLKLTKIGLFFVKHFSPWLTGMDPKGWTCMHRLHHKYSDQKNDPHSPVRKGIFSVFSSQHKSYERILIKLIKKDSEISEIVSDIDFDVHFINKKNLWWLPFILPFVLALLFAYTFGHPLFFLGMAMGIVSHPIAGWLVNSFAHFYGYRNFNTKDNSKNNLLIALLCAGEGYQNNHHHNSSRANFSYTKYEFDWGYLLCKIALFLNLVRPIK